MINNQIKNKITAEAQLRPCPKCRTVGQWNINKIIEGMNVISKTAVTPAKRDFDNPVFMVFMSCAECSQSSTESIELHVVY